MPKSSVLAVKSSAVSSSDNLRNRGPLDLDTHAASGRVIVHDKEETATLAFQNQDFLFPRLSPGTYPEVAVAVKKVASYRRDVTPSAEFVDTNVSLEMQQL